MVAGYVFKEVQNAVFSHFLRGFEKCSDTFDPSLYIKLVITAADSDVPTHPQLTSGHFLESRG